MATANDLNISEAGIVTFDGIATFHGRTLTAGAGITITNGTGISGNPTITLTGGGSAVEHLTGNDAVVLNPDGSNNFNLLGDPNSIITSGSGSTMTWTLRAQVLQPAGTAAAPSYSFQGAANSGVYEGGGNTAIAWNGSAAVIFGFVINVNNAISLNSSMIWNYVRKVANYNAGGDIFISVDTSTIAITIKLPDSPPAGQTYVVKDGTGNAATHNITVTTVSGTDLIDGATTYIMLTNYQANGFIFNGTNWEIY